MSRCSLKSWAIHAGLSDRTGTCTIDEAEPQYVRHNVPLYILYVHIHTQTHGTVKVGRYVLEVLNYASHSGVQNVPFFSRSPVATARNVALSRPSKYHT